MFRACGGYRLTTYFLADFFYIGFGPNFDLKCHFSRKLIFQPTLILRFLNSHGSKTYPRVGFVKFTRLSFFRILAVSTCTHAQCSWHKITLSGSYWRPFEAWDGSFESLGHNSKSDRADFRNSSKS